jgi:hypothetical protein
MRAPRSLIFVYPSNSYRFTSKPWRGKIAVKEWGIHARESQSLRSKTCR